MDLVVNGKLKYHGQIVSNGRKRALQIGQLHRLGTDGWRSSAGF